MSKSIFKPKTEKVQRRWILVPKNGVFWDPPKTDLKNNDPRGQKWGKIGIQRGNGPK